MLRLVIRHVAAPADPSPETINHQINHTKGDGDMKTYEVSKWYFSFMI